MSSTTYTIHLLQPFSAERLALLAGQLPEGVRLTQGEALPERIDLLVAGRPEREHLARPELRALVIPWAGLPAETRHLLADFPHLAVYNLHHNARPVAEMTIALLLAAARQLIPADRDLRRGEWGIRYAQPWTATLLHGKTALILGYGEIGRLVGRLCAAFGMRVLATRRRQTIAETDDAGIFVHPAAALPDLLPQADALLICLPQTAATEGLLGAAELALLPAGGLLVNIGRGAIVDEKALYEALRDGHLAGAGLDVWYDYPAGAAARAQTYPSRFPFHELDNVVLSPHRAGHVAETEAMRDAALAQLLARAAQGEEIGNRVVVSEGY